MLSKIIKFSPVTAIVCIVLSILTIHLNIINAQASTTGSSSISNSNTYINSQCYNDTKLLEITGQQLNISIPMLYCNVIPGQKTSCVVDGEPLSTQFQSDCTTILNGIFNYENMQLTCSIVTNTENDNNDSSSSSTDVFVLQYINYPSCFAPICTDIDINNVFQSLIYPTFESILAQQGYDCTAQESITSTSSSADFYNYWFGRNSITLIGTIMTIVTFTQYVIL